MLPPIIQEWISQLQDPEVVKLVEQCGDKRRLDVTLFSDRGHVNKPPQVLVK
jgi:hypothetical protein